MRLTATQLNALYNVARSVNSLREFFDGVSGIRDLFPEISDGFDELSESRKKSVYNMTFDEWLDSGDYENPVAWEITSKQTGQIYVSRHNPAEWDSGEFECRPLIYGD